MTSDFRDALDALAERVRKQLLLAQCERTLYELSLPSVDTEHIPELKDVVTDTLTFAWAELEIKSADAASGVIHGYGATWDRDLVKDIIVPGAFAKSLVESKAFARAHRSQSILPLLWQHDRHEPIGAVFAADEDKRGLYVKCRLNMDIERGRQAFHALKNGYMSFSIGYKPIRADYKGDTRFLKEISLAEISAVTYPANPEARAFGSEGQAAA